MSPGYDKTPNLSPSDLAASSWSNSYIFLTLTLPLIGQMQILYLLLPQRCRTHSTHLCPLVTTIHLTLTLTLTLTKSRSNPNPNLEGELGETQEARVSLELEVEALRGDNHAFESKLKRVKEKGAAIQEELDRLRTLTLALALALSLTLILTCIAYGRSLL